MRPVGCWLRRILRRFWHYVGDPESERWSSSEGNSWHAEEETNENWSWGSHAWSSSNTSSENWDWSRPRDAWYEWHRDRAVLGSEVHVRGNDSGHRERSGVLRSLTGRGQGDPWGDYLRHERGPRAGGDRMGRLDSQSRERGESPTSPHGRDVSGDLPSGDPSSAGQEKEKSAAGDRKGRISSSYPPIFRAKPGESYKEWKRAVDFWIGGEAGSLLEELLGTRVMVQLRDRAGQLVHHLSNADVNRKDGLQVIFQTLEKSPIIRQLDRHKIDQHRKRLMQLKRLPGESIESYVTRGSIYRTQLQALDNDMQVGEYFFTGHLLDGARLTRRDKVMIRTRAGSDSEEAITNSMIELAPELEGEHGFVIGSSEPNVAAPVRR